MPLQRRPLSPHHSLDNSRTPPLSPPTPSSSQPSFSSASTSESSLSTPFEHLAIKDQNDHPLPHVEPKSPTDIQSSHTDVFRLPRGSPELDVEMFERMQPQDGDRMQSRRSTPGSEYSNDSPMFLSRWYGRMWAIIFRGHVSMAASKR